VGQVYDTEERGSDLKLSFQRSHESSGTQKRKVEQNGHSRGCKHAELDQVSATPAFEISSLQQKAKVISKSCNPAESLFSPK